MGIYLQSNKENDIMRNISGRDLRAMRMVSGLTTAAMAKAADVKTRKIYEKWERNIGSPSVSQFIAMASECGLRASDLTYLSTNSN